MKKRIKKLNNVTVDDLAIMVAKGFESSSSDLKSMEGRINKRFDDIDFRLSRIESNHERRIEILEDRMRVVLTSLERDLKVKLPRV